MKTLPDPVLSKAALHRALDSICSGPVFRRSPITIRLLRHVVECEQAGNLDRLRETVIGHELYGRPKDYDPKLDAIVRVNTSRLRQRLEDHYWKFPNQDVRIILRSGSYVPTYEWAETAATATETEAARPDIERAIIPHRPDAVEIVTPPPPPATPGSRYWQRTLIVSLGLTLACLVTLAVVRSARRTPVSETWEARPFARMGGSQQFSDFSPDGHQLAFVSSTMGDGHKSIYLQGVSSDTPRRITNAPEDDTRPAWSPDGTRITFIRLQPDAKRLVMFYSTRTGAESTLVTLPGSMSWSCRYSRVSWSTDGKSLFASALTGNSLTCGLVRIDVATHTVNALTQPPVGTVGDLDASASPDGTSIAFARNFSFMSMDIFLLDLRSGQTRQVTFDKRNVGGVRWAPDGESLIVSSNRTDGQTRLWRIPLHGGDPTALTDGSSVPTFPAVAPNGKLISFTEFHVVDDLWHKTASDAIRILGNGTANSVPAVSADGRRLVYNSFRSGLWTLWVSDADGSNPVQLLHNASQLAPSAAVWSADGKEIAFECRETGNSNLCLVNADGGNLRHLTHDASNHILPSWSRDGKSLYYSSDASGTSQIYRLPVAGGSPVQVTHSGGVRAVESWDGRSIYVHRGAPMSGLIAIRTSDIGHTPHAAESDVLLPLDANQLSDWNPGKDNSIVFLQSSGRNVPPTLMSFDTPHRNTHSLGPLNTQAGTATESFTVAFDGSLYYRNRTSHTDLSLLQTNGTN